MNNKSNCQIVKNYFKKSFEIPIDWTYEKYQDVLIEVESPIDFNDDEFYPLITVKRRNEGLVLRSILQGKEIETKNLFSVEAGDFIIARMQIIHGACGLVPKSLEHAKISGSYLRFKPKKILDIEYFDYFSKTPLFYQHVFISSVGSNLEKMNFNKKHWLKHYFPVPPMKQQKKIVTILSNMDSLINLTQNQLEQTQLLKKGLMQQLLTKGLGIKKFKKIKWSFGKEIEIPEDWNVLTLSEISQKILDGEHISPKFSDSGIPYLSSQHIKSKILFDNCKYVSDETYSKLITRINPEYDDVLITVKGTIGFCKRLDIHEKFCMDRNVGLIKPIKKIIDSVFLESMMRSSIVQKQILGLLDTSTIPSLYLNRIRKIKIFVPSLAEQKKIASVLFNIDNMIQKLDSKIEYLEKLKKGLMQKLLTGEIRVKT